MLTSNVLTSYMILLGTLKNMINGIVVGCRVVKISNFQAHALAKIGRKYRDVNLILKRTHLIANTWI